MAGNKRDNQTKSIPPPRHGRAAPSALAALKTLNAAPVTRPQASAPPVYRPQLIPKVLQTKMAAAPPIGQAKRKALAPAVYRPQRLPLVLQTKSILPQRPSNFPPVRSAPTTPKILQAKKSPPRGVSPSQTNNMQNRAPVVRRDPIKSIQPKANPARERLRSPGRAMPMAPRVNPSPPRPVGFPARIQTVQRSKARLAEATFIKNTSKTLFDGTDNSRLMEVQSAIFDGRMFIASNYSRGDDGSALSAVMPASYAHGGKTYTKGSSSLVQIAGTLHAEQAILKELAKVIKNPNKVNPSHVTVIGTKRPCTVCRRVLLAFNKALLTHYPAVHLHFVDQSGATTEVDSLDLSGLADGSDVTFDAFVAAYATQLERYQGIRQLPGEDVSNGDRTAATAELDDIL